MSLKYTAIVIESDCDKDTLMSSVNSFVSCNFFDNIILVDNGSENEKIAQLVGFSEFDNILFDEGKVNWGICANAVCSNFELGDICVFTDGSVMLDISILNEIGNEMNDGVGMIKLHANYHSDVIAVRKELFDVIGEFNEEYVAESDVLEDYEKRIKTNGKYSIICLNDQIELTKRLLELSQQVGALTKVVSKCMDVVEKNKEQIDLLFKNNYVRMGWSNYYDRNRLDYEIAMLKGFQLNKDKREKKVTVSITSFVQRMYDLKYVLFSLFCQSFKPDRIVLCLSLDEFPNKELDLHPDILKYVECGLTIIWDEGNQKSYKKLIPALKKFPDDIIVTADDDEFYPSDWLEGLYNAHKGNENNIICYRARKINIVDGAIQPYNSWQLVENTSGTDILPTGCGGCLYPPHSLYYEVFEKDKYLELAPLADDLWFWAMSKLAGSKVTVIKTDFDVLSCVINPARQNMITNEYMLNITNTVDGQNDIQLKRILMEYPQIERMLISDDESDNKFSSSLYWEQRYMMGGNSGAGSYNNLAQFKAEVLNEFVWENKIETIVEWGCGDGNQLSLASYPNYIGYDVSQTAINLCTSKYRSDLSKTFIWSGGQDFAAPKQIADLSISLDVLYHLIEDDIFTKYVDNLFESSKKYVIIYSCNFDKKHATHVRCREFSSYIEKKYPNWKLIKVIPNRFPYDEMNPNYTSWSDFYIYMKVPCKEYTE